MKTADAVVIGGGVIGTSIAFRLARKGLKTILIEKGAIGGATSGSCDKAIFLQSKKPGVHLELAKASLAVYKQLEHELGESIEFEQCGGMIAIESEEQLSTMKEFVQKQQQAGIPIRLLDVYEARQIQPVLADHMRGATWSELDAEVNPLLLSQAFAKAARRNGTEILTHTEVQGIECIQGRVAKIKTNLGEIATETVINAAGPFAPAIGKLVGLSIPIVPRRGVIFISEKVPPILRGNLLCAQYIVSKHLAHLSENYNPYGIGLSLGQTKSGNLLLGGSREFVGFQKDVPPEIYASIAEHACRIIPSLRGIRMIRTMVGFRPSTGDGLPILQESPDVEGFYIAAGHEGDGIALAPITGQIVASLVSKDNQFAHFTQHLTLNRFAALL
ncbi:NAD(P)/FAD-dependent oxidoreductase [Ammoniphilus resinae]|uniref:Sarcosine oxidase subunit beta n=1 Tax=Ammoniphilus resinae TaxID=861532 RepID=A0ABS4GN66_9BACL|nr:FAD-dependent oxidoreductase [Ammoniphilus resinae]MBP1931721.1 sarcosine oxidase subunit beta [Ammoniphilus resinae]